MDKKRAGSEESAGAGVVCALCDGQQAEANGDWKIFVFVGIDCDN
jgi:hypothetical protein